MSTLHIAGCVVIQESSNVGSHHKKFRTPDYFYLLFLFYSSNSDSFNNLDGMRFSKISCSVIEYYISFGKNYIEMVFFLSAIAAVN